MGFGAACGTHLVEVNLAASFCRLERRFGARETAADDPDPSDCHSLPTSPVLCQSLPMKQLTPGLRAQVLDL